MDVVASNFLWAESEKRRMTQAERCQRSYSTSKAGQMLQGPLFFCISRSDLYQVRRVELLHLNHLRSLVFTMADFMGSDDYGSPEREVGMARSESMPPDVILFLEHWMKSSFMVNGSPGSSILIESILSHAEVLRTWGHTQASIVAAVQEKGLRSRLCCDDGQWLRLRDETEQLREVVEDVLKLQLLANDMSLIDMMNQELVSHWLTVFGAELARDRLERVKAAVMTSQKLELTGARIAPRSFRPSPMHSQSDEPAWVSTPSVMFGFCINEDASNQLPVYDSQWQGMQTPMMIPMPSEPDSSYFKEERYMGDTQYTTGQRRSRGELCADVVGQILQQNTNDWAEDGSMSLAAVFEQSYWMISRCHGDMDLAKALVSNGEASPLVVDFYARRVRFRTFSEQLVGLCEMLLAQTNGTILTLSIAVNTPLLQSGAYRFCAYHAYLVTCCKSDLNAI